MTPLVPRLFIGSSSEALSAARALAAALKPDVEAVVWPDVFAEGEFTFESLAKEVDQADFALLLFTPSDALRLRNKAMDAVRDNVVLEFGLFAGKLGRKATFYVTPQPLGKLRIPTDLLGLTSFTYDAEKFSKQQRATMKFVASQVKARVAAVASGSGTSMSLTGNWKQTWHFTGSDNFDAHNTSTASALHVGSRLRAAFLSKSSRYVVEAIVTDRLVTGTWHDAVKGGVYYGSFQLAIMKNGSLLTGRWVGHREKLDKIATGLWEWERIR